MENKKVVVITGATSGLGNELLELFYQNKDFKIFAAYRNAEKIEKQFVGVDYFYMNLLDEKSIVEAAEYLKSQTERIDLLVNCAGAVVAGPLEFIPSEKLKEQFQVNTFSHLEFTKNLLPVLNGSRILNISSMSSFGHFPFISPYCASKRSLDILFNSLMLETHNNMEIVSIKPGAISTPIWGRSVKTNEDMLGNCNEYAVEMDFLRRNALANTERGMNVKKAAEKIYKIATKTRVRSSYLIGRDAYIASIISLLPQEIVNYLVIKAMKYRMAKEDMQNPKPQI